MLRKIVAWLTEGTLVTIQDSGGEEYKTIARRDSFGVLRAYVHWFERIRICVLNEDGTIQQPHYCKKWIKG